jgi:two-component system CheB/CheR fusion protein
LRPSNQDREQLVRESTHQLESAHRALQASDEQLRASLQREQAARREAEAANRLKDEFLAVLSHELRNPLASIVIYSEVLLLKPQPGRVKRAAASIRRNALEQAQLISDLLDLSRLQTGKIVLERQWIDLTPIVREVVESLRAELEAKEMVLQIELPSQPLQVEADPVRMQQVIRNLVVNAIKFTPDGGRIKIALTQEDGQARLTVEDNGKGIEADLLPHVFEFFRQEDAAMTRRSGGMRIGLALVRRLMELHGGSVEAHSAGPGRGTRMIVSLPFDAASGEEQPVPAARSGSGEVASLRILIVDDRPDVLEALSEMLKLEGASVVTATSGTEALRSMEKAVFDLVLSDISMPEMDGYEFLETLRTRSPAPTVPAIALTGLGRTEDIERARAAGYVSYLTKPVGREHLIQAVLAATQSARKNPHRLRREDERPVVAADETLVIQDGPPGSGISEAG